MTDLTPHAPVKYLCVYCGASEGANPLYRQAALDLGILIGKHDLGLVYGGGHLGLMGHVATSVMDHGGEVIGFIPEHLVAREGAHPHLTELHIVDTMHTRKASMAKIANVFVVLPGGFGTLDELFEIITWRQINLHNKPIVILNINNYWDPLMTIANKIVDEKFAKEEHRHILQFVSTPEEVIEIAKKL